MRRRGTALLLFAAVAALAPAALLGAGCGAEALR